MAGRHVYLQTSAINTADTIDNSKAAADMGADAIMVLPPYFEGPTMDGVMWHYEKVAKSVKLPIVVYNIPQNTNIDITPEIFTELMKIENIQYIKDSTANLVRIQQLVATGGKIFNGGDPIAFQGLLAGCAGCIWGAVNAMPRRPSSSTAWLPVASSRRPPPSGRKCCRRSSSSGPMTTIPRSRRRRISPAGASGNAASRCSLWARRIWRHCARP